MAMIAIRRLTSADAVTFQALRLEALATAVTEFTAAVEDEVSRTEADVVRVLADNTILGAFADDRLVGSAAFAVSPRAKARHKGRIWGVYVCPGHRRTGIARRLAEAVIDHASRVVERIDLSVTATNGPALRLYESLGFEPYGLDVQAFRWQGQDHDKLLMTRSLVPRPAQGSKNATN